MDIDVFKSIKGEGENSAKVMSYITSLNESPSVSDYEGGDRYYNFSRTGMNVIFENGILDTVQMFSSNVEENTDAYHGQLPCNLNFSDSQDVVLKKLGSPNLLKEGMQNHKLLGVVYPWCKYFFDEYSLRIEFDMDKSKIRMVSLAIVSQPA